MKGHYVLLAAFGAYATDLLFGIVTYVIKIKIIPLFMSRASRRFVEIT
jgi:hypothetical protein